MASIKEVAALAGVNRSTVSRIINGEGSFRADTKRKVEKAMEELDYRPSAIARSLAKSNSNMVGLMVTYYTGGFFGQMMNQVQLELDEQQKFLITAQGHHSSEGERKAVEKFRDLRCDGFILHSRYLSDEELLKLSQSKTPFVLLDRTVTGLEDKCIVFDHLRASELATFYLLDHGHRRIACIGGPTMRHSSQVRVEGFKQAMQARHIEIPPEYIAVGDYELESGYEAMKQLMALSEKPTAIFSTGEEMTRGVMKYCYEHGIRCPDDISIVSYDSVNSCRGLFPHVTTVDFPITQMAHKAVQLLVSQIDAGYSAPEKRFLEATIQLGNSVKRISE